MPTVEEITKVKWLDLYSKALLIDPINVTVGTEQRIYARTTAGQANNPEGYIVVYAVV